MPLWLIILFVGVFSAERGNTSQSGSRTSKGSKSEQIPVLCEVVSTATCSVMVSNLKLLLILLHRNCRSFTRARIGSIGVSSSETRILRSEVHFLSLRRVIVYSQIPNAKPF